MEALLVEALGPSWLVTLRHGGWQAVAFSPDPAIGGGLKSIVEVFFNMKHAHIFDRATGLALNSSRPAG
jgi:hypothetical protein